jgi:hypothetical protein
MAKKPTKLQVAEEKLSLDMISPEAAISGEVALILDPVCFAGTYPFR